MDWTTILLTVSFVITILLFTVVLLNRLEIIKLARYSVLLLEPLIAFSIALMYISIWGLIFTRVSDTLPITILALIGFIAPLFALLKLSNYSNHKLYYKTLNILRGRAKLLPVFNELKAFIRSEYDVTAYNFLFRKYKNFFKVLLGANDAENKRFVLEVQLASTEDYGKIMVQLSSTEAIEQSVAAENFDMEKFFTSGFGGTNPKISGNYNNTLKSVVDKAGLEFFTDYNKDIQEAIAVKFFELANKYNYAKLESWRNIWVCYYDFSDKTKTIINQKIMKKAERLIKRKYASYNVWLIRSFFDSSVVFFLLNEDLENSAGIRAEIEDDYFSLLKQRDEFNVFDRASFRLRFDSKQNFVENYGGSWYYYLH